MTDLSPELKNAFRCLGVSPDADAASLRSAWRKLVRAYHPDQAAGDKAAANRRLAEINAAFDLVSGWSPEDARAYAAARAKTRAAQEAAAKERARRAEAERRAAEETEKRAAAEKAKREAEARAARDQAEARRKAAEHRAAAARQKLAPKAAAARENFLSALRALAPIAPARQLGFV